MNAIKSLLHKIGSNPVVERALHSAWQAGAGYVIASLAGAHGDIKGVVTAAVALALSAAKTSLLQSLKPAPVTAADMVEVSRPEAPAAVPPAAQ